VAKLSSPLTSGRVANSIHARPQKWRALGGQVAWSFSAKFVSALLQAVVFVLLARGLQPAGFAFASSVYVVLNAFVALNGIGLVRQMQYKRSLNPADPLLGPLYAARLKFTYVSAVVWLIGCGVLATITGDVRFVQIMPTAIWLAVEQTTTVWNGISIIDHQNQALFPSYLYRRVPVVLALVLAVILGLSTLWAWTIGLAVGSVAAYVRGLRLQEPWARVAWPWRERYKARLDLDFGYWWFELGNQLRDLDVTVVSLLSAHIGGIYAFPARLIRPMNLVTQAAGSVAFPVLARRKLVTLRQLTLGVIAGTAPVALIAIIVAIAANLLPAVAGQAYVGSVRPLQILCLAALFTGASALLMVFLQSRSTRANNFAGYVSLFGGALQVAFVALGAIWAGAVGAALGATTSVLLLLGLLIVRAVAQCRFDAQHQGSIPPPASTEGSRPSHGEVSK
jgi:O-antigen/teichoic acid export membrane protein